MSDRADERTTACGATPHSEASGPAAPEIVTGDKVGRYTIVERLGSGGMGVVYRARDPGLDRDVALKVLRGDREHGTHASRDAARLLREARTLARLSHGHVVQVFDVGTIEGSIFIAMELVEGQTLRAWMREGPHPIAEILDVFEQAAQGLVAAHRAGLVHRDFKPDNVLMRRGPDGWICKVVDFGLARLVTEHERSQGGGQDGAPRSADSLELTAQGNVVGTPAYMAPEQHRGQAVVPASDQYSFCVVLFEAVRGHRPFRGATYRELVTAKRTRRFVEAPATVPAPPHVERVISRGLEPNPDDRWPSMEDLLEALRNERSSRRWRAPAVAVAGVSVLGVGWGLQAPAVDCEQAEARLAGIWDGTSKAAVRDALLEAGGANAASTWARVEERLDAYAERWAAQHDDACAATHDGSEPSEALLDLRSACLDGRRAEFEALVEVLRTADPDTARHAVEASAALPTLTACADEESLRAAVPPPDDPVAAARVRQLRLKSSETRSLAHAGRIEQADELAHEVLSEARALEYPPLLVEALEMAGRLRNSVGDYAGAESLLSEGYWLAREVGHDAVAASIAIELLLLLGEARAQFDTALEWAAHAKADLERAGGDPALRRRFLTHLGVVHFRQGDFDASQQALAEALAEGESSEVLLDMGNVLAQRGQLGVAREHYQRAADLTEAELGSDHPRLATAIMNVGSTAMRMGDFEVARAHYERAIGIFERSLGPNNPELGNPLANMGILFAAQQQYDQAQEHFERAAAIWESSLGPEHPAVAQTKNNLGRMLLDKGDAEAAAPLLRRALELEETAFGADAPATVVTRANLARALLLTGQADAAAPHAERAVELSRAADMPPSERGVAEEIFAEVAWALGERELALNSAQAALQSFTDAPDDFEASVVRLRAWLDERTPK